MEKGQMQMSLVEELSFVRYGGTDDELRAANIIRDKISGLGGESELMDFTIPGFNVSACSMSAGGRGIECVPYGLSGSLPEGGAELRLYYACRGREEDYLGLGSLEGYAVLLNGLTLDSYRILREKNASAFITFNGKWYDDENLQDLYSRTIRPSMQELGRIPGFMITARDATELVRGGVESVHLELVQEDVERTSRDVLAVIPGSEITDECVVLTAHMDSVPVGTGSWDNASGAANLMALYAHFLKNPPRRTMRFIWCGSEEQGLLGSKAWIARHEDMMDQVKMCFNFDMCGTVLGPNEIYVTGGEDLKCFAEQYAREVGWSANIVQKVHSSDSAPFADRDIPSLGITRRTDTAAIHVHNDLLFPLSPASFADMEEFSAGIIGRAVNSRIFPVPRGMPDSIREGLDRYFHRKKS